MFKFFFDCHGGRSPPEFCFTDLGPMDPSVYKDFITSVTSSFRYVQVPEFQGLTNCKTICFDSDLVCAVSIAEPEAEPLSTRKQFRLL